MKFELRDYTNSCISSFGNYFAVDTSMLRLQDGFRLSPTNHVVTFEAGDKDIAIAMSIDIHCLHRLDIRANEIDILSAPDDTLANINTVGRKWYLYQTGKTSWEFSARYYDLKEAGYTLEDIGQDLYNVLCEERGMSVLEVCH